MSSIKIRRPPDITGKSSLVPKLKNNSDMLDKLADVQEALNSSINTLAHEINKLRVKSRLSDLPLTDRELRSLTESVKVLLTSERQQIEAQKITDLTSKLSEQSNSEILEFIKNIVTPEELKAFAKSILEPETQVETVDTALKSEVI